MIELLVYAKLAIPTRANVFINSSICIELSGPTAVGKASEGRNILGYEPSKRDYKNILVESGKNIWCL